MKAEFILGVVGSVINIISTILFAGYATLQYAVTSGFGPYGGGPLDSLLQGFQAQAVNSMVYLVILAILVIVGIAGTIYVRKNEKKGGIIMIIGGILPLAFLFSIIMMGSLMGFIPLSVMLFGCIFLMLGGALALEKK
ncbi:MAG: DUF4064 domain-containing protein [Candidatus Aenigmarchaeota archaeon]|nr:DUF4064 domain-containing protein [Candidatus Aenigmarchaeota archaeon]